jgi:DNA-binding NarL/FixJ family response regulator
MWGSLHRVRRVLIADDNRRVNDLIRVFLSQRSDLEVLAQTVDGPETIYAALQIRPDLIILDVVMPGLNGIEVASVLRERLPDAKTILFTMYDDHVGKRLAECAGVDVVLPKVNGLSALSKAVDDLFGAADPVQTLTPVLDPQSPQ